jgi:hypothetical protein
MKYACELQKLREKWLWPKFGLAEPSCSICVFHILGEVSYGINGECFGHIYSAT